MLADVSRQETVKVLSEEITPATTVTSAIGDAGKGSSEHSSVVVSASGTSSEATPSSKALPSPVVAEPHTINAEVKCDGPWPGFSQCSDKMAVRRSGEWQGSIKVGGVKRIWNLGVVMCMQRS